MQRQELRKETAAQAVPAARPEGADCEDALLPVFGFERDEVSWLFPPAPYALTTAVLNLRLWLVFRERMNQNAPIASHSGTEAGQALCAGRAQSQPLSVSRAAALRMQAEGFGGHDCGFALGAGAPNRASIQAFTSDSSQATARAPRL